MEDCKLTVVVPTKNEARSVGEILAGVKPFAWEVLVVDGHSQDGTREIAAAHDVRVIVDSGKGKGAALRLAIQEARGDVIGFIDADGSHDPTDLKRLAEIVCSNQADLAIGSRMRGGSDELHSTVGEFLRLLGSGLITLLVNYRFGVRLTDTQNGLRVIKTSAARQLNLKENITTIEQEMVIKALKGGYRVTELPTHEYKCKFGQSTI